MVWSLSLWVSSDGKSGEVRVIPGQAKVTKIAEDEERLKIALLKEILSISWGWRKWLLAIVVEGDLRKTLASYHTLKKCIVHFRMEALHMVWPFSVRSYFLLYFRGCRRLKRRVINYRISETWIVTPSEPNYIDILVKWYKSNYLAQSCSYELFSKYHGVGVK